MNLLDSDSNDDSFTINEDYAKRYDKWRQGEELQKLKDKYGDAVEIEESTSSSDEDDDAVELTEDVEKRFFKTLACLKTKDPKIYDENTRFFEKPTAEQLASRNQKKKKKPETLTMAAYHRQMILNQENDPSEPSGNFEDMPLADQERTIKNSFKDALKDSDDEGDSAEGLFKKKNRTTEEIKKEEEDYRQWLAGQKVKVDENEVKEMEGLREFWTDPKLNDGEKFLRDYILNHRYLEKEDDKQEESSESEDDIEKQEEFEHKFNFRFQEPDQDFIRRYPRTVEQSLRKKDDRRIQHREEVKARKLEMRKKKDEELKRLKALKRAEIMDKIKKLKDITGNETLGFQEGDVEGDFDPAEHDKRMSELFTEEFYGTNVDEEKPVFSDSDEELQIENWDEWTPSTSDQTNGELHCEDPGFVMDCDYDPALAAQQQLIDSTKRRKKHRQSKFAAAVAQPKPVFDPTNKTLAEYMDEYYGLDYEDIIDGIPCRFKYRKVVPNDYGLTVEEILAAPDKELNQWASVKKIMRRRPEHIERNEVNTFKRMKDDVGRKMKLMPSLFATEDEPEPEQSKASKKKKRKIAEAETNEGEPRLTAESNSASSKVDQPLKKKRKRNKSTVLDSGVKLNSVDTTRLTPENNSTEIEQPLKKKRKKNKSASTVVDSGVGMNAADTTRLTTEINSTPSKNDQPLKKKRKKNMHASTDVKNSVKTNDVDIACLTRDNVSPPSKKKRKKNKSLSSGVTGDGNTVEETRHKTENNTKSPKIDVPSKKKRKKNKPVQVVPVDVTTSPGSQKKGYVQKILDKKSPASNNLNESATKSEDHIPKKKKKKRRKGLDGPSSKETPLKTKRKNGTVANDNPLQGLSDARLKSYGLNPKKFRNKLKYGGKNLL